MDLKIVYLLFACLLSIALVEGEEEAGDGGSKQKGSSDECECDGNGRDGRGHGGRRRGGQGWGGRGGKDGEKKCFPISLCFIEECKEMGEQISTYFHTNKEEMKKCKEMETREKKHKCMADNMEKACKSDEVKHFPGCWSKMTELFGPK